MTADPVAEGGNPPASRPSPRPEPPKKWLYEIELAKRRTTEADLRAALAREESLLRRQEKLLEEQQLLSKEADHRIMNGLHMIMSLIMLQSRKSTDVEVSAQLTCAANRVAAIERVHRCLHCLDGVRTVAFRQYLEELCRDFAALVAPAECLEPPILVEGDEVDLPTEIGIPLGFIVSEMIMNAAKYGRRPISVRLARNSEGGGYALSVSDDGPGLPEGFDPAADTGLGMRIIRSLVGQIAGELRIGSADGGRGTRFTVLFA